MENLKKELELLINIGKKRNDLCIEKQKFYDTNLPDYNETVNMINEIKESFDAAIKCNTDCLISQLYTVVGVCTEEVLSLKKEVAYLKDKIEKLNLNVSEKTARSFTNTEDEGFDTSMLSKTTELLETLESLKAEMVESM